MITITKSNLDENIKYWVSLLRKQDKDGNFEFTDETAQILLKSLWVTAYGIKEFNEIE